MSMMHRLLLVATLLALAAVTGEADAQCTGETETGRRLVLRFATESAPARPAGVPVVSGTQVRVLTNPNDSPVCHQLFSVFWGQWHNPEEAKPDWHWTFYAVGDLYYVVAHRVTPPVLRNPDGTFNISLTWSPIFVMDREYRVVASVAR